MRNFELIRKVRDQIQFHPETHKQGVWAEVDLMKTQDMQSVGNDGDDDVAFSCGTSACVAGWAVTLAGCQLYVGSYEAAKSWVGPLVIEEYPVSHCVDANNRIVDISYHAEKLLGITNYQASLLFSGGLCRHQVLEMLDILSKEDISVWSATHKLAEICNKMDCTDC